MRGTIEAGDEDQWRIRAYAGSVNGKVRWASRTVHGGKRAAQTELAKLVAEVGNGQLVASHPVTLGELVDRWLSDTPPHRTLQAIKEYRGLAEANVKYALSNVPVNQLNGPPDRWLLHLVDRVRPLLHLTLRWSDIAWDRSLLRIARSLTVIKRYVRRQYPLAPRARMPCRLSCTLPQVSRG